MATKNNSNPFYGIPITTTPASKSYCETWPFNASPENNNYSIPNYQSISSVYSYPNISDDPITYAPNTFNVPTTYTSYSRYTPETKYVSGYDNRYHDDYICWCTII